jgi:D-aminopeptidase
VKLLISADTEGATGVTWPADVEPAPSSSATEMIRCFKVVCTMISAATEDAYG